MSLSFQHIVLAGALAAAVMESMRVRRLLRRDASPRPATLRRRRRAVAEAEAAVRTQGAPEVPGPHLRRRPLADRGELHPDDPHPVQVALAAFYVALQVGIVGGALLWTLWPGPWAIVLGVVLGITAGAFLIRVERRRRGKRRVPTEVLDAF